MHTLYDFPEAIKWTSIVYIYLKKKKKVLLALQKEFPIAIISNFPFSFILQMKMLQIISVRVESNTEHPEKC